MSAAALLVSLAPPARRLAGRRHVWVVLVIAMQALLWRAARSMGADAGRRASPLLARRLAPTRRGWAAGVALSVLATPRLTAYIFMTFLAVLRRPAGDG